MRCRCLAVVWAMFTSVVSGIRIVRCRKSIMLIVWLAVGSALWCLRSVQTQKETFKSAMTKLIMAGGDADTNGAVAGGLMGALCGYDALPGQWRDGMKYEEWYKKKIDSLCVRASLVEGEYDAAGDTDTLPDGGKGFLTEQDFN